MRIHLLVCCPHPRFISVFILLTLAFNLPVFADKSPYDWAEVQLDYIRQDKTGQLRRY